MKTDRIIYYIATGLLSVLMLFAAGMYIFNHGEVAKNFALLGFPVYIIYPLAIAKILGIITIWISPLKALKEWAYAGFFFNFLLALSAHINAGDGQWFSAALALVLLIVSYIFYKRIETAEK